MPTSDSITSSQIKSGIYAVRCISGKVYIGSAANIVGRWRTHRWALSRGKHHSVHLQRAWGKYSPEGFTWEVLEYVANSANLIEREQYYIDKFQSSDPRYGFNISPTARSPLGTKHTEETRRKMSAARKGRKLSPEAIAAMKGRQFSAEHRHNLSVSGRGRKISPEGCANIAAARRGKKLSAEHRAKIAAAAIGRIPTKETRAKLSKSMTPERKAKMAAGHRLPETRAKIRATHLGKRKSEEHREKLAAHLRSPEHRAKVSAALKGNQHTLGKPLSPEHKAKLAEAGRNQSPEKRAAISEANRNRSPEIRAKMAESHRGKRHTPETRAKISAAHKGQPKRKRPLPGQGEFDF